MTKNQIKSHQTAKLFLDVEFPDVANNPALPDKTDVHGGEAPSKVDATTPYVILEQHTFWDLDDDGYAEPYIITIEEQSQKVLRIVARFDSDGIHTTDKGEVILIDPVEYFTKYEFIPNPDGGFYGIGFGHLLGPINESTNTVINQLIDAGTLANLQAGFIGKGLRLKMGEAKFQPGEWKAVNATGDDIKKQIFPLPTKEPSEVLFKLLGLLIESGKELASVAEIFTGKMPGQNTPATTTQATIEQGMKVFTAIYKRNFRSLSKEFKKVFRLNSLYEENFIKAQQIMDEPISKEDYDRTSYDVCPTADPTAVSSTQKLQKASMLMELIPLGTINIMEATKRILEGQEQPNVTALMQQPQPQVDPKVQAMQMKGQMDKESHQMDMQKSQLDAQMKAKEMQANLQFKEREQQMDLQMKQMEIRMKAMEAQLKMKHENMQHNMDLAQAAQQHQQTTELQNQKHQQGIQQLKEKANAQRDARAVSGVAKTPSNSGSTSSSKPKNK
jgi:chaperonin GroES